MHYSLFVSTTDKHGFWSLGHNFYRFEIASKRLLCFASLFMIATFIHAQVKPNLNLNTSSATIKENRQANKTTPEPNATLKKLNTSVVLLERQFNSLKDGEYSVMPLKLASNIGVKDYYVQKFGSKLYLNGDIVVYDFSLPTIKSYTRDDEHHTFGRDDLYRWPDGVVPVVLENSVFEGANYLTIKAALDYFNFNTGIIFKERGDEEDYLVITCKRDDESGKAGSSPVGRQRNGSNVLELVNGKFTVAVVLHELMHTLGVFHEQSRPDRDNFVEIKWDNIKEESKHNFQVEDDGTVRSAYDYCSIMQYSTSNDFSIDKTKPTIVCKSNGNLISCPSCINTKTTLSKMDLDGLDVLYRGIGISRFPSNTPFVSSKVPIAGCIGVSDNLIRAKWDYYKNALGDCRSKVTSLGIFNASYVDFEHGQIYHTARGVFAVYGVIFQLFKQQNGMGSFGLPVSDEEEIKDGDKNIFSSWSRAGYTRVSKFEKGIIVWGPTKGAKQLTNESFADGPNPVKQTTKPDEIKGVQPNHSRTRRG
jgi:hypothetical protein